VDTTDIADRIREAARPLARAEGVELLDARLVREGPSQVLRLTIEREGAPTSVADCERVSKAVERALDTLDVVPGSYVLEVSSAGLTRPLRTLPDFKRAIGVPVRVVPRGGPGGPVTGILREAGENGITLELPDSSRVTLTLDDVSSARRELLLFNTPRGGKHGRKS
jgi:ribosome maturation factor RimP